MAIGMCPHSSHSSERDQLRDSRDVANFLWVFRFRSGQGRWWGAGHPDRQAVRVFFEPEREGRTRAPTTRLSVVHGRKRWRTPRRPGQRPQAGWFLPYRRRILAGLVRGIGTERHRDIDGCCTKGCSIRGRRAFIQPSSQQNESNPCRFPYETSPWY